MASILIDQQTHAVHSSTFCRLAIALCTMYVPQTCFASHRPTCTLAAGLQARRNIALSRCRSFTHNSGPSTSSRKDAKGRQRKSIQTLVKAAGGQSHEDVAFAASASTFGLWLLSELPGLAAETTDFSKGGFAKESYYVTLGLFLISLPGAIMFRIAFY